MNAFVANDLKVRIHRSYVLNGLQFEVPEGSFFTVIGPNGAGKSVLLKTLIGLIPPTHGRVSFFGKDPRKRSFRDLGYVPQLKTFDVSFPATGVDFVASGLLGQWPLILTRSIRKRCHEIMVRFHCDHLTDRNLGSLSGGELQRLYLARALVRTPKTLILDEPSTGMDVEVESDLYHQLETIRKDFQTTIMMVTHDQTVAAHHSTHVLLLNQKQIAFGEPEDVLSESHLRVAFGHQSHAHAMPMSGETQEGGL